MRIRKKIAVSSVLLLATALAWAMESLPELPPIPADNAMTPAKIELGRQLYFDKRLSRTGEVSCNSCHNVGGGGTDNAQFSTGVEGQKGGRNAPTVWNAAFLSVQFWDGRAATLEEQAKGPMVNPVEMGMANHDEVVKKLSSISGYKKKFAEVFGQDGLNGGLTIDNVARAIAAFERTLITANTPFDLFMKGDRSALSKKAQSGMKLVQTIGCTACHSGPNFSGPQLPTGQGFYQKFPLIPGSEFEKKFHLAEDLGRYQVTKSDSDKNMWRVPTWRNVALTAPYFHNGSVKTLAEAVRVMAKTQLGKELKPREIEEIVAFLESLSGKFPKQKEPTVLN